MRERARTVRRREKGERVRRVSCSRETERESHSRGASGRAEGESRGGGDGAIGGTGREQKGKALRATRDNRLGDEVYWEWSEGGSRFDTGAREGGK